MFKIRSLKPDHIGAIAQIEKDSRISPWTAKQFTAELENANSRPLVLIEDQTATVVGYVIPWIIAGEIQIQNIVVAETHRGLGLGGLLLNIALDVGLKAGCDQAILEVRESNKLAIGLYHQYQFVIVGRREAYYRDGENALLMTAGPFTTENEREDYRQFISKQATKLQDRIQFQVG